MNEQERELVSLVIGYQIRNSRRSCGLSQADLAQGIGSQSMMSLLESGRQFPLPDVLELIATRLHDEILHTYAQLIASGQGSFVDFAATNRDVLLEVLRAHRGKWHDTHGKLAIQLCEHFYYHRVFRIACEICHLVLHNSTDPFSRAHAHFYLGSSRLFLRDAEDAETWLLNAEQQADQLPEPLRARLYYNLGYTYVILDSYGLSMWYAKMAVDAFRQTHDYHRYAKALGLLGLVQSRLGRLQPALETLQIASEMCEKWELPDADRDRIHVTMADVCETLGDYERAEALSRRVIESHHVESDLATVSAAYRILSLVHLARADVQRAREYILSAIQAALEVQDSWSLSNAYLLAVAIFPTWQEKMLAATCALNAATECNHVVLQAISSECLANLYDIEDPDLSNMYRRRALASYRHHLDMNDVHFSGVQYLNKIYES